MLLVICHVVCLFVFVTCLWLLSNNNKIKDIKVSSYKNHLHNCTGWFINVGLAFKLAKQLFKHNNSKMFWKFVSENLVHHHKFHTYLKLDSSKGSWNFAGSSYFHAWIVILKIIEFSILSVLIGFNFAVVKKRLKFDEIILEILDGYMLNL